MKQEKHQSTQEKIKVDYNYEKLNKDFKFKSNYSHIVIIAPKQDKMPLDLPLGIYQCDRDEPTTQNIRFDREALFPWEIQKDDEFLIVDSVFPQGAEIRSGGVKIFKIIFPLSIAENSYHLKPRFAKIVKTAKSSSLNSLPENLRPKTKIPISRFCAKLGTTTAASISLRLDSRRARWRSP